MIILLISLACTWSIIVVQGCKLLNLMGLPCQSILCCIFHLLSYTLPFAVHGEIVVVREGLSKRDDNTGDDAVTSSAGGGGADGGPVLMPSVAASVPSIAAKGGLQFTSKVVPVNIMLGLYLFLSFSSTVKVHEYLIHDILAAMLLRDPTDEQKLAASLALYFTFSGLLILAFWRSATLFRRYARTALRTIFAFIIYNFYFGCLHSLKQM